MRYEPQDLPDVAVRFLAERHLATLSLIAADGSLHVSPVGFSWDPTAQVARVITFASSKKVRLLQAGGPLSAVLAQVDGGRWLSLYGLATVTDDPSVNADAERRYAARYRPPGDRGPDRRTVVLAVDRVVGRC